METEGDIAPGAAGGVACDNIDADHEAEENRNGDSDGEYNKDNADDGWDETYSA